MRTPQPLIVHFLIDKFNLLTEITIDHNWRSASRGTFEALAEVFIPSSKKALLVLQ